MNLPELKEDFYKRFNQSDSFLHFTANGLLCTLLGHSDIEYAPSLTFTLSMRVQMFARRLGGNMINLQDTSSAKSLSYTFGTPIGLFRGGDKSAAELLRSLERYKPKGAEILYECSIPEFLPKRDAFAVTLVQSIMKVSGIEADTLETAALAGEGSQINPCLGIITSKKGYCTLISTGEPKNLPLPLSGYKILSAHCTEKEKDRSRQIKSIFEQIRRIYPHTGSIWDITPDMFNGVKSHVKDKTALRYMYHLINENSRIKAACAALKRCDTSTLFREMKISQKSMERFWDIGSEHMFLARCCEGIDGIAAARSWRNGIIAITEDEKIDHAIGMIKDNFESIIGYQPTFCVSEPF